MQTQTETENQTRLRRAKEALAICQDKANEARKTLMDADTATKQARERYEALFIAEENLERKRLRETYNHTTN